MFRKHLFIASALAGAAAVILLATGPGIAQHWGGYHHGGYRHGGYYPGHYGGYYHHYGYYPRYSHYGLGYSPWHYGSYWAYHPWYYYAPRSVYGPVSSGYQAFYPGSAGAPAGVDQVVHFDIRVPANATIWFDGEKTTQTGSLREFVSPPLAPGRQYAYELRARWTEDGREVTQSRRITVRAGERVSITFPQKTPEKTK